MLNSIDTTNSTIQPHSAVENRSSYQQAKRARSKRLLFFFAFVFVCPAAIWLANYALIGRHVANRLSSDSRNAGFGISAHYNHYLDVTTLVLDLTKVQAVSPLDLFRGLFQSAEAMYLASHHFDRVVLARKANPVFTLSGNDFAEIGSGFHAGQNPMYLIRTLPERLHKPNGENAFGHWEGGWLGVLEKQMNDASEAGRDWAGN